MSYNPNYSDENTNWDNEDVSFPAGFFDDLPKPLFWRVVIAPMKPKEVSRGGIVLVKDTKDAQEVLNCIGKVVAMAPSAGTHERLGGDGKNPAPGFPKVGEYVAFGRFAGQKISHRNVRLLLCNDDELLAVVPNPETLQVTK